MTIYNCKRNYMDIHFCDYFDSFNTDVASPSLGISSKNVFSYYKRIQLDSRELFIRVYCTYFAWEKTEFCNCCHETYLICFLWNAGNFLFSQLALHETAMGILLRTTVEDKSYVRLTNGKMRLSISSEGSGSGDPACFRLNRGEETNRKCSREC